MALSLLPAGAAAQEVARVRSEENFRRDPNGELLGRLTPGTPLDVVARRDGWLQVDLQGWVWERSLQVDEREGMDLVIFPDEGENIRAAPSGTVLGRLEEGTLLLEVDREPGWIQVRRRGWIWEASVEVTVATETEVVEPGGGAVEAPTPAAGVSRRPGGFSAAAAEGAPILTSPGGDTLAIAVGGAELETVAREGNWVRVRVEGWTWMPEAPATSESSDDEGDALTPQEVMADPGAYRGRVVAWTLQFISLEEAERVRTDFFEGEPFLLCRYGGSDGPFVYVAVPPGRVGEVEGLVPLESIDVTGRIRTGSSALTGTPIIELHALERLRGSR